MLHEVAGDILLSKAEAIAHGVAPHDHFDSGLALSIRERWPALTKDFRHYCHERNPKPGELWSWAGAGGVRIVNLMTQEAAPTHEQGNPGQATLAHVNHALRELRKHIESEEITSIALPKIATGVGGLEWSDVKPLIEKNLGDLDCRVIVYTTFRAGQEASEFN